LAYPTGGVGVTFFMYNKKLVGDAGLDFEANPPMNTSGFDAACEQLKSSGIQPIITGESGFERFVYFITNYWWGQLVGGSEGVLEFNAGERTFAEDNSLVEVFTYYEHLYEKSYLNKDAASAGKDSLNRFFQGEAAMLPSFTQQLTMAADAMGGFQDVGILFPPDISARAPIKNSTMGGPGKCFVVAKESENPDMAIKLASFLSSKEEVMKFSEVLPVVSIRRDMTSAEMGLPDQPVYKKLLDFMNAKDRRIVYWVDQVLDQAAMTNIAKLSPLILTGKMTPKELALEVNKAMAER
jgi:ABC-type glycerol-3-phosphate transport system substrate-binding protein